ncbi:Lrp/AsnC family transcriptional regulator [Candidatus Woesearchaeota archaeon]|nr:Lrp/AsnC family transcriptional regulator [Candidatus Woesearchaeota archaeon]
MNKIITKKDERILAELDNNSRQTDSQIAKKTGLSKQVANYRISKLIKRGIISDFYTTLDVAKLGFNSYYVFLQLENINKEKEEELIARIKALDFVGWLITGVGKWDACLLLFSASLEQFDSQLGRITNLCGGHLYDYNFIILISSEHISYKFVGHKEFTKIKQEERKEKIAVDKTDLTILKEIAPDARISLTDIQKKTKIPIHTAAYRIKQLEKQKIILGYKPKLDVEKLGHQWHLLLLKFQSVPEKRKNEFISFCENHKSIYYITRTIGLYNLMLDVHVKSNDDFRELIQELRDKFSDVIKLYESIVVFKEHKISYYPEELMK